MPLLTYSLSIILGPLLFCYAEVNEELDHDNDSYSVPTGDHDDDSYSVKTTAKKESAEKEPGPVAAVKSKTMQASCRSSYRCRRHSFDIFRQSLSSTRSHLSLEHL